jgi:hypothetical protein
MPNLDTLFLEAFYTQKMWSNGDILYMVGKLTSRPFQWYVEIPLIFKGMKICEGFFEDYPTINLRIPQKKYRSTLK